MAKALYGYVTSTDPRAAARLEAQNRSLRQRIADLETMVVRLQAENDQLVAAAAEDVLEPV